MARFHWNAGNIGHIAAHGVTPAEAEEAYNDPRAISRRAIPPRAGLIGQTEGGRILAIIYERFRTGTVRIITAYEAQPNDRRAYLEQS